jgi:hypothetical protein
MHRLSGTVQIDDANLGEQRANGNSLSGHDPALRRTPM